jgi:hypothetical protein
MDTLSICRNQDGACVAAAEQMYARSTNAFDGHAHHHGAFVLLHGLVFGHICHG